MSSLSWSEFKLVLTKIVIQQMRVVAATKQMREYRYVCDVLPTNVGWNLMLSRQNYT